MLNDHVEKYVFRRVKVLYLIVDSLIDTGHKNNDISNMSQPINGL